MGYELGGGGCGRAGRGVGRGRTGSLEASEHCSWEDPAVSCKLDTDSCMTEEKEQQQHLQTTNTKNSHHASQALKCSCSNAYCDPCRMHFVFEQDQPAQHGPAPSVQGEQGIPATSPTLFTGLPVSCLGARWGEHCWEGPGGAERGSGG